MAAQFVKETSRNSISEANPRLQKAISDLICENCGNKGASWQDVASDSEITIAQTKCLCELCVNRIATTAR